MCIFAITGYMEEIKLSVSSLWGMAKLSTLVHGTIVKLSYTLSAQERLLIELRWYPREAEIKDPSRKSHRAAAATIQYHRRLSKLLFNFRTFFFLQTRKTVFAKSCDGFFIAKMVPVRFCKTLVTCKCKLVSVKQDSIKWIFCPSLSLLKPQAAA